MNPASTIDWTSLKARIAVSQTTAEQSLASASDERVAEIYRDRARLLSTRSRSSEAPADAERALVFVVDGERFCIPVGAAVEVLRYVGCSAVPGAPAELLGVVNVRGQIYSVLDLALILDLPVKDGRSFGYILLVQHEGVGAGLRVDEIEQIEQFSRDQTSDPSSQGAALSSRYVRGRTASRAALLDISAIFSHPVFQRGRQPSPKSSRASFCDSDVTPDEAPQISHENLIGG
jgi:purine-binding chemotaxis protein CheW